MASVDVRPLKLHSTPFTHCCPASPWVSLQFLFVSPPSVDHFFFLQPITDSSWRQLLQAPPLSQVLLTSVFVSATENTKKNIVTSSQHFFLNSKEGSVPWTEPTSGLRPQEVFPRACRTLTYTRTDRLC